MKQELEINLNELLENDNVTYGSHKNENHYYFQTPLLIQTKMNQHIIEGMASASHDDVSYNNISDGTNNNNDTNTLKMFKHSNTDDNVLESGESIHLLGNQEMICTEQGADEAAENDYVPDESMEKHIYTALSVSFVVCAGLWYASQNYILNIEFIRDNYDKFLENSIIIRLGLLFIAGMFLGLGGGYGSKNPSLPEKRGAISFMVFAGLFFALGVMPVNFDVDTNNTNSVVVSNSSSSNSESFFGSFMNPFKKRSSDENEKVTEEDANKKREDDKAAKKQSSDEQAKFNKEDSSFRHKARILRKNEKVTEEAARLKAEEEAALARKKAEEEAARLKAEEEAALARKKAEEEAALARKKAEEEAALAKKKEKEEKERKERERERKLELLRRNNKQTKRKRRRRRRRRSE
jgi:hypothetical protein